MAVPFPGVGMNEKSSENTSTNQTKVVVLVCEEALETIVLPEMLAAGAKGYTVTEARGRGNRGVRDARWLLSSNVRIEAVCNAAVAKSIIALVEAKYSSNYGLMIYATDAEVLNPEKY